jgi:RNA-dependent RNA polymerase
MWFVNNAKIDRIAMARWMGMPTGEKVVAKYAARMGLVCLIVHFRFAHVQAFSASRGVDTKFVVTNWKDIERLGNCFTDGCSIAGQQVMKEAAAVLGVKGLSTNPSAIQFRLG